jgi:hypothetical protein
MTGAGKRYLWPDKTWRTAAESVAYLERCAKLWEGPPHNAPDQAARVRAYARRIKARP